jgi:hypothetical protein
VARSYRELFGGYATEPRKYLKRTFEEVGGYDELVVLRDIRKLIDIIQTSDDYLLAASKDRGIFEVHYKRRRPLQERLASGIRAVVKGVSGEPGRTGCYLSYSDPSARPTDTRRWPSSVQTWTCQGLQQTSQSCTRQPSTSDSRKSSTVSPQ